MVQKKNQQTLVLLDAHAIIHRAYHAMPDFSNSAGEPTGALYGIVAMLVKILQELKPDYVVACYDLHEKTFRHHAFAGYKGHREKADDSLAHQIGTSREIFAGFGIPMYEASGFEADDVLGTITEQFKKDKTLKIIIATGDMDTLQLVDDKRVQVYTLRKGIQDTVMYDEDAVMARYGFGPELVPDYKGLRGDPSDNIPGVKGIGEKTATELILKFGTIENLYKILAKNPEKVSAVVKDRIVKLLTEQKESAEFSKTLATIRRDAPIHFNLPEKKFLEGFDQEKITAMLEKFEFKSLVSRVKNLLSQEKSSEVLGKAQGGDAHFPPPARLRDTPGSGPTRSENVHLLPGPDVLRAGIMLFVLDSNKTNPTEEDILAYTKKTNIEEATQFLSEELRRQGLMTVFEEIEEPIMPIVAGMTDYGISIDEKYFKKLSGEYHTKLSALEKEIYALAGEEFNINSPKQMSKILFEKLGLASKGKRGKSGNLSTRAGVLEELADDNVIVEKILEFRELAKLLSTYIDLIPTYADTNGRIHPRFIQAGAVTGRFASENPGIQNIPIKTELGRAIRNGFIAPPGKTLVGLDYSQMELRIAAMLSGDEKFMQIFKEGKDVHRSVASLVLKIPEDQVDYEQRRRAKTINFGILYGMGVRSLRKQLGTTMAEAEQYLEDYRNTFATLHAYFGEVLREAAEYGYTQTLFGRRRQFASLRSPLPYIRAQAERMAINAPIQGTGADMIKLAIRFADEDIRSHGWTNTARLILQVHDELIYEVDENIADEVIEVIKKAMSEVCERSFLHLTPKVPIGVEAGKGKHLGEL